MIAKFTCIDGKRDDLYAGLAPMMDHVGSEEGTLLYQLLEDPTDAGELGDHGNLTHGRRP